MILRMFLFVFLCAQTQILLPMMEPISETGGTPADLLDSLKKKSDKGKEHAQKSTEEDLHALRGIEEDALKELELAVEKLREINKTDIQKTVSPQIETSQTVKNAPLLYLNDIANDFDVKKYPGVEIITLVPNDTKQINKAF